MPQIEVIATDGKMQKRILWIDVKGNGIYSGWCMEDTDFHLSYHKDGNVFRTRGDETRKLGTYQPLKDFKNFYQIGAFVFTSDLSQRFRVPDYTMKKLHSIAYIDVRYYIMEKCDVGCNIFLLEPKRFELLELFNRIPCDEVHLFTQFNPWILINFYKVKTALFNK